MSVIKYNFRNIQRKKLEKCSVMLLIRDPKMPHLPYFDHIKNFPQQMDPHFYMSTELQNCKKSEKSTALIILRKQCHSQTDHEFIGPFQKAGGPKNLFT